MLTVQNRDQNKNFIHFFWSVSSIKIVAPFSDYWLKTPITTRTFLHFTSKDYKKQEQRTHSYTEERKKNRGGFRRVSLKRISERFLSVFEQGFYSYTLVL